MNVTKLLPVLLLAAILAATIGPVSTAQAQGGLNPAEMANAISELGKRGLAVHMPGGLPYFAIGGGSDAALWSSLRFLAQPHDIVPAAAYATGVSIRVEVRFVDPAIAAYMGEHRWLILDMSTWASAFVPVLKEQKLLQPTKFELAPALVPAQAVTTLKDANALFPVAQAASSSGSVNLPNIAPANNLYLLLAVAAIVILGGGTLALAFARH